MNILIRPLEIDDAAISFKWRNDSEIWTYTGSKPNLEVTELMERKWLFETLSDKTKSRFAILVDNVYVGNVQLTEIIVEQSAEYHIFLGDKSFWGKGVASEATYQILIYAKEYLNLSKVFLDVRIENIGAIKSYVKNGFYIIDKTSSLLRMRCDIINLLPPIVSVFCMVYNHGKFLRDTLEGFLMQKTNFSTIIVIGEDCSTDNSRELLLEYVTKYPGKFKLLLHDNNIGANANQHIVLENCNGKYVALCEGDDYWTDPLKLQKQVDFLEENLDYNFSMGIVDMLIEKTGKIVKRKEHVDPSKNESYRLKDYLKAPFSQTSSFVFRNEGGSLPNWFKKVHAGDQSLVVVKTGLIGKIKYHNELFSIYRINEISVSFTTDYNVYYKFVETLSIWNKYLGFKYDKIIRIRSLRDKCLGDIAKFKNPYLEKIFSTLVIYAYNFLIKLY